MVAFDMQLALALADPDVSPFLFWFVSVVAVITVMSLASLRRSEEALQKNKQKLEDQIVQQQNELMRTREQAAAWRLEMQRQFDAHRADASRQLADTKHRASAIQQHLDETVKRAWAKEAALMQALDKGMRIAPAQEEGPVVADSTVADLQSALTASEQKVAALQQALTLERLRARRAIAKSTT